MNAKKDYLIEGKVKEALVAYEKAERIPSNWEKTGCSQGSERRSANSYFIGYDDDGLLIGMD